MNRIESAVLLALVFLILGGCSKPEPGLSSADRTSFVGRWAGNYTCPKFPTTPDTLIIATASEPLEFSITIHSGHFNPDLVTGTLTQKHEITIPKQIMGGALGTAQITVSGSALSFTQTGFGVTCTGNDYHLF